ncbi:MAG: dTMP kinase [Alphaproteobacteria bacterium]
MSRGKFITLEGGEGTGKSTQCARLAARLEAAGVTVVQTREPGGTEAAERVRALLVDGPGDRWDAVGEALLHSAARRSHLVDRVWPALEGGAWVVCDRFADSTMAYQGYAMGLGRDAVETLTDITAAGFTADLTLLLDLAPEDGLRRAGERAGAADRYERRGLDFHQALRDAFLDIAGREPERFVIIDGSASVDDIADAIFGAVSDRLGVPGDD